jgi:putative ribosome biogenesis GTPase RsgA
METAIKTKTVKVVYRPFAGETECRKYNITIPTSDDVREDLETVWRYMNRVNNGPEEEQLNKLKERSLVLGDEVEIDNKRFRCAMFGWEEVIDCTAILRQLLLNLIDNTDALDYKVMRLKKSTPDFSILLYHCENREKLLGRIVVAKSDNVALIAFKRGKELNEKIIDNMFCQDQKDIDFAMEKITEVIEEFDNMMP